MYVDAIQTSTYSKCCNIIGIRGIYSLAYIDQNRNCAKAIPPYHSGRLDAEIVCVYVFGTEMLNKRRASIENGECQGWLGRNSKRKELIGRNKLNRI